MIFLKAIFEAYKSCEMITQKLILSTVIFVGTTLLCSACAFYLAEFSDYYYDMRALGLELLKALRSCSALLSVGIILINYFEKNSS